MCGLARRGILSSTELVLMHCVVGFVQTAKRRTMSYQAEQGLASKMENATEAHAGHSMPWTS